MRPHPATAGTLTALRRISLFGIVLTLPLAGLLTLAAATEPVWPLAALATVDSVLTLVAAAVLAAVVAPMTRGLAAPVLIALVASTILAGLPFADAAWSAHVALGVVVAAAIAPHMGRGGRVARVHALLAGGVAVLTLATGLMQGAGGDLPMRLAIMGALMATATIATLLFGALWARADMRTRSCGL